MEIQSPSDFNIFSVISDHDDFMVISKKEGISFHDEDGVLGLSSYVRGAFPQYHLYPVHRLDKVTSGIIVFAKSAEAAEKFRQLFATHQIEKVYLAISREKPQKKQGSVIGDMVKSRRGMWKLVRTRENPATTKFVSYYDEIQKWRVFELFPKTGKTHQLRVMMKSLGAPILGDSLYGGMPAPRCYLHAYKLSFMWNNSNLSYLNIPHWQGIEQFIK